MEGPVDAGARVRVAIPRNEPSHLLALATVPVLGATGTVDRVDERLASTASSWWSISGTLGARWTDRFKPGELAPA